jgi:hypothetical protein
MITASICQPGEPERSDQRQGRRRARELDPACPAEKNGYHMPSHQKGGHQKSEGACRRLENPQPRNLSAFRQLDHHAQDQEPEDVVDHGRAQDDLALRLVQAPQVREHACRDSDAGGRQGRRRDDRHDVVLPQ